MRVKHLPVWIMLTALLLLLLQSQLLFIEAQETPTTTVAPFTDNSMEQQLTTQMPDEPTAAAELPTTALAALSTAPDAGYQNDAAAAQLDTTAMPSAVTQSDTTAMPSAAAQLDTTVMPSAVAPTKCYSCNSGADASCALRPAKLVDCQAAASNAPMGCYTRFKLDTKQLERGCLGELPAEAQSYCNKHKQQCDICLEPACNVQKLSAAVAVAASGTYGLLSLSMIMAWRNWLPLAF